MRVDRGYISIQTVILERKLCYIYTPSWYFWIMWNKCILVCAMIIGVWTSFLYSSCIAWRWFHNYPGTPSDIKINVIWPAVVQLALISDFRDKYTNYMLTYITKRTTNTLMGILQTNVHLNFNSRIEIREIHL